jgi:hypothetical protein
MRALSRLDEWIKSARKKAGTRPDWIEVRRRGFASLNPAVAFCFYFAAARLVVCAKSAFCFLPDRAFCDLSEQRLSR